MFCTFTTTTTTTISATTSTSTTSSSPHFAFHILQSCHSKPIPSYKIIYFVYPLNLQITSKLAHEPLLSWEATAGPGKPQLQPLPTARPRHSIVPFHNTIPPAMRSKGYCHDREVRPDSSDPSNLGVYFVNNDTISVGYDWQERTGIEIWSTEVTRIKTDTVWEMSFFGGMSR